jgi:hypothetical protein
MNIAIKKTEMLYLDVHMPRIGVLTLDMQERRPSYSSTIRESLHVSIDNTTFSRIDANEKDHRKVRIKLTISKLT